MPTYVIDITSLSPGTQAYAEEYACLNRCITPEENERFMRYLQLHDNKARFRRGETKWQNGPTVVEELPTDCEEMTDSDNPDEKEPEESSDDSDDSEDSDDDEPRPYRPVIHGVNTTDIPMEIESEGFWFGSKKRYGSPELKEEKRKEGLPTPGNATDQNTSSGSVNSTPLSVDAGADLRPGSVGPIEKPDEKTKRKRSFSQPELKEKQRNRGSAALETSRGSVHPGRAAKRPRKTPASLTREMGGENERGHLGVPNTIVVATTTTT